MDVKQLLPDNVKQYLGKADTPVGRVIVANKLLKVADMNLDQIRLKLNEFEFAHSEELAVMIHSVTSPFKHHRTALKFKGLKALMADEDFVNKLKASGKTIPDSLVTTAVDQISKKFDDLIKIF